MGFLGKVGSTTQQVMAAETLEDVMNVFRHTKAQVAQKAAQAGASADEALELAHQAAKEKVGNVLQGANEQLQAGVGYDVAQAMRGGAKRVGDAAQAVRGGAKRVGNLAQEANEQLQAGILYDAQQAADSAGQAMKGAAIQGRDAAMAGAGRARAGASQARDAFMARPKRNAAVLGGSLVGGGIIGKGLYDRSHQQIPEDVILIEK